MSGPEMIGLLVSAGLLAYLASALLKPEWFA
jgi:K+-transporting ATPase KdpF subunit